MRKEGLENLTGYIESKISQGKQQENLLEKKYI